MIDKALDFLRSELNVYLHTKLTPPPAGDAIILYNVSQLQDASGNNTQSNAFITLVNIEEDRVSKPQENFIRKETGIIYKNPETFVNLYVLFSANLTNSTNVTNNYNEALRRISLIIQFFQNQNVFDQVNSPTLDPGIIKLVVDMYSLSFEQLNHLWGVLGGKYLPSVLYKIRKVSIDEGIAAGEAGFIKEIQLLEKNRQPAL